MKKLLAILLVGCLLITSVFSASVYAESEYDLTTKTLTMPEIAGKYKTQGRTVLQDDILMAHYPATGIEFNAYCSGDVSVTFNVTKLHSTDQTVLDEYGGCFFTVIIDGVKQARDICKITTTGDVTITIAEALTEGVHNFEIYRQNEITHANLGFKSITLNGELLDAPANKDTYIEFVGASQWGGWGAIGDNTIDKTHSSMPIYQDVTQGLTYLTAEQLDTDWSIVSVAGMGAYWGGQTMNTVYDYVGYYNDKTTLYDFARQPDYVVIGLGTNDVSKAEENGKSEEDIYEAFDYFIRRMRFKNPNAKIVWVHGMMTEAVDKYVEKVVEDLGGAEYGVYDVKVTQNNDGASSHPSAEGHAVMAEEISAFIETIKEDTFTSELPKKADAPDPEGEVLIESDFSSTTNWTRRTPDNVTYVDEDSDGTNDFARLTGSSSASVALRSTPASVIPGNDYELSFYARIPEGSKAFHTDTYKNYPLFVIYQPTLNSDGTRVTDNHSTGKNEYSYSYSNGTTLTRRTDLITTWQIGNEFAPYTRKGYSMFDSTHQYACAHISPDEVYKDWTKVTVKFTASASDDNDGAQTIALYFALNKGTNMADCMLDIKDVKLINTSYVEPEETEPGVVFSEGFETLSDVTTVIKNGTTATWVKYEITEEDAATGNKSAKVFTPYNVSYIPLDKSKLVENSEYEFSINWKMLEYTETKARQLRYLRLAGWNPSEGDTVKNSSTNIGGIYTATNATGDWINTSFKFTISDLDAYEEFIIKFDCASTQNASGSSYTQAEDSIWIDDIKLVGEVKEQVEGKIVFTDFDDYSDTSKWKLNIASSVARVSYKDEDSNGVKDYVQLTSGTGKHTYITSVPFTLVPGTEYELSYYVRVPNDSAAYVSGETKSYPKISIYQPTIDSETGLISTDYDGYDEATNCYARKNVRRDAFTSTWQIGDYASYTQKLYSVFGNQHYEACEDASPNDVYAVWTKVTVTFTAIDDEANGAVGDQVVALRIGVPNILADTKLDIKNLVLIDKSAAATEPELPEGTVYYEDFENLTDASTAIEASGSWNKVNISNTEYVSGSKSASVYGYYSPVFIPFDKAILEEGTVYNFFMNWKLTAYTAENKCAVKKVYFVGWNPSTGETLKNDATIINGVADINGTGDWVNTSFNVKLNDLDAFESYGVYIYYALDENVITKEERYLYIDDITLKVAEIQDVITPIELNEAERTEDTIKVLAFGNSFSKDATEFIDELATADGVDLRVGNAWIGGCSLQKHYSKIFDGTFDYTFDYHNPDATGGNSTFSKISMYQALTATDWDYITIQQVSGNSGKIDTFEPYLSELLAYFKEVCPNAEIRFHMTWAYEHEYSGLEKYENSQTVMYESIIDTYLQVSQNYDFARLIPSGEAIQRLRATEEFAEQSLNRDGFHLTDKGRITAALVWYETFTGISALDTKFNLTSAIGTVGDTVDVNVGITAEEDLVMRTAAHEAASLYKKANETQLAIEAIGTVTEESGEAIETANTLRAELGNDTLLPNLQTLIDANATYKGLTFVAGDLSDDGITDLEDVNLLAQHLAGWNVEVNEDALDTDGDGLINLNDLILLAQFVAGWDVELA